MDIRAIWNQGNDEGRGWGIGEETDTPEDALRSERYAIQYSEDGYTLGKHPDGSLVICADANGPWAVSVPAEAEQAEQTATNTGDITCGEADCCTYVTDWGVPHWEHLPGELNEPRSYCPRTGARLLPDGRTEPCLAGTLEQEAMTCAL